MPAKVRLSLLVLVGMLALAPAANAQDGRAIGTVASLVGTVQVERFRGGAATLAVDDDLYEGDRVTTASASRLKIVLVDGSMLQLGERTELELSWVLYAPRAETQNVLISVGLGIVRTVVEAVVPRSWFELRTPTAITSVRGTDWILEAASDATAVVSLSGEVAVANRSDQVEGVVVLGPGEGTTVRAGEPPAPVSAWGQARIDSFIARTDPGTP